MNNRFYCGHFTRKRFAQNFLVNQLTIENIISAINPKKDQAMVEIGPGLAALTEPIGRHLDHLTVIELDRNLANRLRKHPLLGPKMTIYQKDAMTINFNKLSKKIGQPLRIFGNLPYNISTPLMFYLFKYANAITDMHFMLQKEVVDRLVAKPNSKAYGRLSVMTQYYCQAISILDVHPDAFIPSPKVESAVVRLIPYTALPYPVKNFCVLNHVVTEAFKQRRKKIRNSLSNLFTASTLTLIGVDSNNRADDISVDQYCKMANYISETEIIKTKLLKNVHKYIQK